MSVFADTSGIYAVFDQRDVNHSRAMSAWEGWLRQGERLVTRSTGVRM